MTKPTDSKVPAAFQAMLAFLRYLFTGDAKWSSAPEMIGVLSACSLSATPMLSDPDLLALRDLVQAAADEHAETCDACLRPLGTDAQTTGEACAVTLCGPCHRVGAAEVAAQASAAGDPFAAIKAHHEAAERGDASAVAGAHNARAWLIGEVERLRAIESDGAGRTSLKPGSAPDGHDASGFAVHLAFDAYAASRATLTGTASTVEQVTFTRLEGETPEAFRARIALHLNGMGSTPFVLPGQGRNREALGEIVRGVRAKWLRDQRRVEDNTDWDDLEDHERDLFCTIGVALATVGQGYAGAIDAPTLTEEAAQQWAERVIDAFKDGHDERDEAIAEALLAASRGEYPAEVQP